MFAWDPDASDQGNRLGKLDGMLDAGFLSLFLAMAFGASVPSGVERGMGRLSLSPRLIGSHTHNCSRPFSSPILFVLPRGIDSCRYAGKWIRHSFRLFDSGLQPMQVRVESKFWQPGRARLRTRQG